MTQRTARTGGRLGGALRGNDGAESNQLQRAMMRSRARAFFANRLELPLLARLGAPLPLGTVLDVGCGPGTAFSGTVRHLRARQILAFDIDTEHVRIAAEAAQHIGVPARVWVDDVTQMEVAEESVDVVLALGVLHHVEDWRSVLPKFARALKPGGRLLGQEALAPLLETRLSRRLLSHPSHDRFDAEALTTALWQCGFRVLATREAGRWVCWYAAERRGQ